MAASHLDSPFRLSLAYGLFGAVWILGTDGLATWWGGGDLTGWLVNSLKGLLFIGVTAVMLHLLVRRLVRRHIDSVKALRDSEQRLALALEAANQGLYDQNVQTGEVTVNDTYASMLGYDPAGFRETSEAWRERLHPEDRDKAYQVYIDYLAGRSERHNMEFRQRTADGSWRWILSHGRLVERDTDGRPRRLLGTHTDITDRKSAEARTRDALAFAHTVLHFSPEGVITYGANGIASTANEAAARMVGTDVRGLLGQNFHKLESWKQHGLLAAGEKALATGKEVVHRGPFVNASGRALWIEGRFVPFRFLGEDHLLVLLNDETEQRRASENLNLLSAAVQASPSGWLITDAEGRIEFVNPGFTAMTGYTSEEAVGRKPSILKSGRQNAAFYTAMWETIRRGEVWHGELENCRKDGAIYQEQMTIAPVRDPQGRIAHYVAVKHDISEQKKLEQQITRAQRLESIGQLASGIAHDLNNILAPITLALELLKLKHTGGEAPKMLELIENSAQRGAGIVRQVLTFARGVDGVRIEVQPRHLLREIGGLIDETFPRNIRSDIAVAPDVCPVLGDVTQLHQVLLNLAVNARDAMPEGGVLHLGAENVTLERARESGPILLPPGRYVALVVADTGIGITPEVMERMFEPFYTTKPLGKGTGLGLSTVYGIVRSHGGLVEVQSRPGEGTEFRVLLPAVTPSVSTVSSRPPRQEPLAGAGRRLLVVDDEEAIREVTAETLTRRGFVVETAADGVEGLDLFRAGPGKFAAVLTDLMMPRMNGYQLAAEIRRLDRNVPILASSGVTGEGMTDGTDLALVQLGILTRLTKPYTEDRLLQALAAALQPPVGQR
ncbi:MAG: PAS domain S-box protein [Opitutae bacterium]|nr:PAS domain S-box protein [Opitutae bacterium]